MNMVLDETFDWVSWKAQQEAVLCFVVNPKEEKILLIEKKTGFGAGKVNGPGGKIEKEEEAIAAAIRETQEEIGIQVSREALQKVGELSFQFADGYAMHCTVFLTDSFAGTPTETEEAKPFWSSYQDIPYDRMWQDDIFWIPSMLEGKKFKGFFCFDEDRMLSKKVENVTKF